MVGQTVHAAAALVGGRGVLIRGASGSGKSSLLLALLDRDPEAVLIADDRVTVSVEGGRLLASTPEEIAGLMEIRGVGIVRQPHVSPAEISLVVDLLPLAECPRLPSEGEAHVDIANSCCGASSSPSEPLTAARAYASPWPA